MGYRAGQGVLPAAAAAAVFASKKIENVRA